VKTTLFALISLALLMAAAPAAAQNYRVRVTSGGDPVPYAYVLVGDAVQAMTDGEGRATIRRGIEPGEVLSARFVGMESVPLKWEGAPAGEIELQLIPNEIDAVVVTARRKDRSRQYFRKYVDQVPTHGWYTGFSGRYEVTQNGPKSWRARGDYRRDHVPGQHVGALEANTFILNHAPGSDSTLTWQLQRYLLTAKGIAERAVQFNDGVGDRGLVLQYRGRDAAGLQMFLVVKPYYDRFSGREESFQTLLRVGAVGGVIYSTETVSQSRYGIWNVSATYAVHSNTGRSQDRFIYPVRLSARFEERSQLLDLDEKPTTVDVVIEEVTPYHFSPPAETTKQ